MSTEKSLAQITKPKQIHSHIRNKFKTTHQIEGIDESWEITCEGMKITKNDY